MNINQKVNELIEEAKLHFKYNTSYEQNKRTYWYYHTKLSEIKYQDINDKMNALKKYNYNVKSFF